MTMYRLNSVPANVRALPILQSASGSIASFNTDLTDDLVEVKCQIVAMGGGGTPSTPIPISSFSACSLVACGRNVLPKLYTTETKSNVTLTVNSDGTLSFSGIASGLEYFIKNFNLKKGSYIFTSGVSESFETYDTFISKDGTTIARGGNNMTPNNFTLTEDSTLSIVIRVRQGVNTSGLKIYPMIRLSSDSDTTYAEYNGTTKTIPFGQTVYGGSLDVLSGKLTIKNTCFTVTWGNGTNSTDLGSYIRRRFTHSNPIVYPPNADNPQLCDKAPYLAAYSQDTLHFYCNSTDLYLYLPEGTSDNEQITVCAELQTPTTIQLSSEEVASIVGNNNIYADTGDTSLKYWVTIDKYIGS